MVHKLSIHNRLALVLLGAALLAFVVAGAGLALFQRFTLEDRTRQIMEPYAQLVSVGTDAAVAFEDPQRATEILDTLRVNPQILEAVIYLDNQRPLASFTRTPNETPWVLPDKANGLYISHDTAEMLRALPHGARLHIKMGLNQLGEQTRQVLWLFGVGALVFLLATLGQLAVLRRTIVRPIASLTHAAELARANADYQQRVPSDGSDEVARLGRSFNDMMAAIQQREEDLQRLTFFQRTILDNVAYGVISASPQGLVTSFNPAAERLLGYTAEEVVNLQTPALWHDPQELARYATQLSDQLGKSIAPGFDVLSARPHRGLPEENEWTYIRKDGKRIQVNLSVTALRDERARITGFVGLVYDLTERKHAQHQLQLLSFALDQIRESIFMMGDNDPHFLYANESAAFTLGYPREELTSGMGVFDIDPDWSTDTWAKFWPELTLRRQMQFESLHRTRDGRIFPVEVTSNYFEFDGKIYNLCICRDITKRRQDEQVMRRLNRELRAISDCNQVLVRAEDEQTLLENICRIVCEKTDYRMAWVGYAEHDEARTVRPVARAGADMGYLEHSRFTWADTSDEPGGAAIRTGGIAGIDDFAAAPPMQPWCEAALQSGYLSCIALPLNDESGNTFGMLGIYATEAHAFTTEEQRLLEELANDLAFGIVSLRTRSERTAAERRIEHLAFYDPLTELPNRRLLMDRLDRAMTGSARTQHMGALLFIDLDNFKMLNDTCGHDVGDRLLIEVAHRLATCVRDGDTISRLGGDEFVVMLEGLSEHPTDAAAQAQAIGEKVLSTLNQSYVMGGRTHHSTPSIGATLFVGNENSVDDLLKQADIAMYQAKAAGRNTLRFFDPDMQAALAARADMETAMRQAIKSHQFVLHYQAQVHGQVGIVGAEALLRWNHPLRGIVSPAEFIPLAEETGLILPLGQWVLEEACERLAVWSRDPYYRDLYLAVNVSARQFHQTDFVERVRDALQSTEAPATRLKLELTESLVLDNISDTIAKMHLLKGLGVSFSMDDFGTGYSSLSYLTQLPLNQLKIDQSFVHNLPDTPNDAVVVQAIITLAQSLGLDVIAEGVETEAQRQFLHLHGCPIYQGYLFSQPVPHEAFAVLVQDMASPQLPIQRLQDRGDFDHFDGMLSP